MKTTGFRKQSPQEIKEKQDKTTARRIASLKAKQAKAIKRTPKPKKPVGAKNKPKKTVVKGYIVPKWYSKLKPGSHGSTPTQKKYWKVLSDTYRKADWEKYGTCVSCHKHIEHWQDGDLAHFKRYSVCNSWFKFQRENMALSCKNCNRNDDGVVGHTFGEELKRRHHKGILEWIEATNLTFKGQKMQEWEIVEKVANLRPDLVS